MAIKKYESKTRYEDLARFHLDLLDEVWARAWDRSCQIALADSGRANFYDCKDASLQCTIMCAAAVQAEGMVLMLMTQEAFSGTPYLTTGTESFIETRKNGTRRTKNWENLRNALEEHLKVEGVEFPAFRESPSHPGKDELDELMHLRNEYVHLNPQGANGLWILDPVLHGKGGDFRAASGEYRNRAHRHWEVAENMFSAYRQFWEAFHRDCRRSNLKEPGKFPGNRTGYTGPR